MNLWDKIVSDIMYTPSAFSIAITGVRNVMNRTSLWIIVNILMNPIKTKIASKYGVCLF